MRKLIAIWLGKTVQILLKITKIGGGSAAPGLYALKVDPELVRKLSANIPQTVVITGTNGKTTTARLLSRFAKANGLRVIRNSTGSNMARGIVSKLVAESSLMGRVRNFDLAIWEVDEATVKTIIPQLKPEMIIFLNAARDQLDRYGELDSLIKEWRDCLNGINFQPIVLLNGDDANTYSLKKVAGIKAQTFGTGQQLVKWEKSTTNPKLDFKAKEIRDKGLAGFSFQLKFNNSQTAVKFPLPGLYHVYDILASFAAAYHLNLSVKKVKVEIENYSPAFGRVESVKIKGKDSFILLIKNPSSASQVFGTIAPQIRPQDRVLLALNDNLADGTDISWIWDANFELLCHSKANRSIVTSGKRAEDLALRLKYAGMDERNIVVESNIKKALNQSLDGLKGRLFILPTYTALLEMQKILAKMGVKKHYWEEA